MGEQYFKGNLWFMVITSDVYIHGMKDELRAKGRLITVYG